MILSSWPRALYAAIVLVLAIVCAPNVAAAETIAIRCNPPLVAQGPIPPLRSCQEDILRIGILIENAQPEMTTRLKKNKRAFSDFVRDFLTDPSDPTFATVLIDINILEDGTFEGVILKVGNTVVLRFNGRGRRLDGVNFNVPGEVPGTFTPGSIARQVGGNGAFLYDQLRELASINVRPPAGGGVQGGGGEGICNRQIAESEQCSASPILLDIGRSGFTFTSLDEGVDFDIDGDGELERTAWMTPDSDDAFLVLDLNGNGTIDGGRELFGDATLRENGKEARNGYQALRDLDLNGNFRIDPFDDAYWELELWTDANHNGISEPAELTSLEERGVAWISVRYRPSRDRDEYGNRLAYYSIARVVIEGRPQTIGTTDVYFQIEELD